MSSLVQNVLQKHGPGNWTYMNPHLEMETVLLEKHSYKYSTVENKVKTTLKDAKISSIYVIQNPYLWGCYQLKKEEVLSRYPSATEMKLFHATSRENAKSICKMNFDWRRSYRVKYGAGVSFSPSADYANLQCNIGINLHERALILSKVIVGAVDDGSEDLTLPCKGATVGNCEEVYVKYCDNDFYPSYVVHYESPKICFGRFGRRYV